MSAVSRIHHLLLLQGSQYLFLLNHLAFFSLPQFLQDNYFGSDIIAFSAKDSRSLPCSCGTEDFPVDDHCHERSRPALPGGNATPSNPEQTAAQMSLPVAGTTECLFSQLSLWSSSLHLPLIVTYQCAEHLFLKMEFSA